MALDYDCPSQPFGDEGFDITYRGTKLSQMDALLSAKMWANTGIKFWAKKHSISNNTAKMTIDWDICKKALTGLKFHKPRCLVKHATGHFGNGVNLKRWGFDDHDECPLCTMLKSAAE
jgi:hypothetical protein